LDVESPFWVEWHAVLLVPDAFAAIALKHPDGFLSLWEDDRPDQFQLAPATVAISLRISLKMSELFRLEQFHYRPPA
jgi:hypothetical protein